MPPSNTPQGDGDGVFPTSHHPLVTVRDIPIDATLHLKRPRRNRVDVQFGEHAAEPRGIMGAA